MEILKNLIARLRHVWALLVISLILISYIAFGFLYYQQGAQQRELEEQIARLISIVSKPLSGSETLQTEYDEILSALVPMTDSAAIALLVSIAEENGIDINEGSDKFRVPSATLSQAQVAGGNYQLLSFRNIYVRGDHDNVMAFISDLDSGKTLETMILKRLVTGQTKVGSTGESENATPKIEVTATVDVDIYTKPQE